MARKHQWDGVERRHPPLVLVAGGDAATSGLLTRVLEARGYRASTASTAEEALERVHERSPRCVILDLTARGMESAMLVLDGMRRSQDARVRRARVIVVARSGVNRNFALESGADGFLERPFHADELVALIGEVLAVRPEERGANRRRKITG